MKPELNKSNELQSIKIQAINEIDKSFDVLVNTIVGLSLLRLYINNNEALPLTEFIRFSALNKQIDKILINWSFSIEGIVFRSTDHSWVLAEKLAIMDAKTIYPKAVFEYLEKKGAFAHNIEKLTSFKAKKYNRLKLSDRVWKLKDGVKIQIEQALQVGIVEGKSAHQIAIELKKYLRKPDKLFRRVRDLQGNLKLSKAAKAYNPGTGVYRSSYKNALRLATNEINRAHRLSNYELNQRNSMVVGIEIRLSDNHTLNGKEFKDICDDLAGIYPKSFLWTGWHVGCRCEQKNILKSEKEMFLDEDLVNEGKEPSTGSKNTVNEYPAKMKSWIEKNRHRYKPGSSDWIDSNEKILKMFKVKI